MPYKQPFEEDPTASIPMAKLATQNEAILFYEEVPLFEDELHDCGIADLTVRIVSFPPCARKSLIKPQRVMPSCLFLLSRFFLRVDKVLFRVYDVRIYHEFGSDVVIRETKGREDTYDAVKEVRSITITLLCFAQVQSSSCRGTTRTTCRPSAMRTGSRSRWVRALDEQQGPMPGPGSARRPRSCD
jgi:hypothetical protein